MRKSSKPTVVITDSNLIPLEYKRQKIDITLDKEAIADAIKSGTIIAGATLELKQYLAMGPVKKE